jgi:hypothetical protein
MKLFKSPANISTFIVFLTLIFSTGHYQSAFTHSFNPHFFIKEHRIECVLQETVHYLDTSFFTYAHEKIPTSHHQLSTQKAHFKDFVSSLLSPTRTSDNVALLIQNSISNAISQTSLHIFFIKHQSFSDCTPDDSFLI